MGPRQEVVHNLEVALGLLGVCHVGAVLEDHPFGPRHAVVHDPHQFWSGFIVPAEAFELSEISRLFVDNKARIQVKTARYSVQVFLAGRQVSVRLTPLEVIGTSAGDEVCRHDRLHLKNSEPEPWTRGSPPATGRR